MRLACCAPSLTDFHISSPHAGGAAGGCPPCPPLLRLTSGAATRGLHHAAPRRRCCHPEPAFPSDLTAAIPLMPAPPGQQCPPLCLGLWSPRCMLRRCHQLHTLWISVRMWGQAVGGNRLGQMWATVIRALVGQCIEPKWFTLHNNLRK